MWIYTTGCVLLNLDYFDLVSAEETGTYVYRTINNSERVSYRISQYDVMDKIAPALSEGKNYLEV